MSSLWQQLFGREAPVEIEIGPERGTFLRAISARHPERNYLGIERSSVRHRRLEAGLRLDPRPNVRVVCGDAACVVAGCVPQASVAAYHIYFPDPWWKRKHQRRRLLTPEFAADLAATLIPGGAVYLVTDVEELFAYARRSLGTVAALRSADILPARPVRSAFEQKAIERGSRLYTAALFKDPSAAQRRSA